MNKWIAVVLLACVLGLANSNAMAGDKNKDNKPDVFTRFDENKNGVLDPDEIVKLREAYAKGDASLKVYDTNSDGKLDENEIAAIKPPEKGGKKKKK